MTTTIEEFREDMRERTKGCDTFRSLIKALQHYVPKEYYSAFDLLLMLDEDKLEPTFFNVVSHVRGPGKTFSFSNILLMLAMATGRKFGLLTRNQNALGVFAQGVFGGMLDAKFDNVFLTEEMNSYKAHSEVILNYPHGVDEETGEVLHAKEHIGYVIPLTASNKIKTISSTYVDVDWLFFDEFQPEYGGYLKDEVARFKSIYTSIARGGEGSIRDVKVFLSSNMLSAVNPYFQDMGIYHKLNNETKRARGKGWVFQKATNPGLAQKHAESGLAKAFGISSDNDYLNDQWRQDNDSAVGKPKNWGESYYIGTVLIGDRRFGVRLYDEVGVLYMGRSIDESSPFIYRAVADQSDTTSMLLKTSDMGVLMKNYFNKGRVWFQDQSCKLHAMEYLM